MDSSLAALYHLAFQATKVDKFLTFSNSRIYIIVKSIEIKMFILIADSLLNYRVLDKTESNTNIKEN